MRCRICSKSAFADGIALFRQNPKGEVGIWACREHNGQPIDSLVDEIVTSISDDNDDWLDTTKACDLNDPECEACQ